MRAPVSARVGAIGVALLVMTGVAASTAVAATTSKPSVTKFVVSPSTITVAGKGATVSAVVRRATSCVLSSKPALSGLPLSFACGTGAIKKVVTPPANTAATEVTYSLILKATGAGGTTARRVFLSVTPFDTTLTGVVNVASGSSGSTRAKTGGPRRLQPSVSGSRYGVFCAVESSGTVECWGDGETGALGDGSYGYSNVPVEVVGVGGTGLLSGAVSVVGNDLSFCALLDTGNVDCWGYGYWGDLGDGVFYPNNPGGNDIPVQVSGVGGSGLLAGVASITSNGEDTYCALLDTGNVDCWGIGDALGNGVDYQQTCSSTCDPSEMGSATPVQVLDPDGIDLLSDVQGLTLGSESFCAVLTTGGVDCWGYDYAGQNGDGTFATSGDPVTFTPTSVVNVGGDGLLSGVTSLSSDGYYAFCATVTGGGADCWGWGTEGELGNDVSYSKSGSGTPVQVASIDGTTTLADASSVTGGSENFCALLGSGDVACWGTNEYGSLGEGVYDNNGGYGSDTPVSVVDTTGSGQLSNVTAVSGGVLNFCATLASGGLDCWGQGNDGQLGNGILYSNPVGDGTPSQVLGGTNGLYLTGVQQVAVAIESGNDTYCAVFGSANQVACWGFGNDGELGNGTTELGDATPVDVVST